MNRILALLALPILVPAADAADTHDREAEVWAGEEAYWRYVEERNVEGFLTLWHSRFRGWPCGAPTTVDTSSLREDITAWFASLDDVSRRIENRGVIVDDDFAVTYVAVTASPAAGDGSDSAMKLVHTWRRTAEGWKIIGGMCGPLEQAAD